MVDKVEHRLAVGGGRSKMPVPITTSSVEE